MGSPSLLFGGADELDRANRHRVVHLRARRRVSLPLWPALMGWDVYERPSGIHVVPDNDLVHHELAPGCVCVPAFEQAGIGIHGRMYTHHSLDGRELYE